MCLGQERLVYVALFADRDVLDSEGRMLHPAFLYFKIAAPRNQLR
jgi:hypothetical protein